MAEYLHLYRDDEGGTAEIDYDLRGSVYWLESDGWTPATMPDVPYEEQATATEVLTLGVFATTAAGVADAIADLRRLLTEARRRASLERYPSTLTYLRHYPDGGSEDDYRTAEVVGGAVRWSKVLGRRIEQSGGTEYVAEVVVEIEHRAPLGEPETLKNLCPNPSFEWDTNSDGLANGWAEIGTTANQDTAIAAVDNRYGAYGQELTLTAAIAADTGIWNAANITVTAETEYHLKIWVDNSGNTNIFRVYVRDITGDAAISGTGLTWAAGAAGSQQTVSFTTPAACVAVRILAYWANGAATAGDVAVVDGIYLGLRGARAPQAWSSYYSIQNHCDGAAVSTHHNWLDVAEVPGECEAVLETVATLGAIAGSGVDKWWWRLLGGRRATEHPWHGVYWLQGEAAVLAPGMVLGTDADAMGTAANNYVKWTMTTAYGVMQWQLDNASAILPSRGKYRTAVRWKGGAGADAAITFYVQVDRWDALPISEIEDTVPGSDYHMSLGPVISLPQGPPAQGYQENCDVYLYAHCAAGDVGVSNEVSVDAIALIPVDEVWSSIQQELITAGAVGHQMIMDAQSGQAIYYYTLTSEYKLPLPTEGLLDGLVPEAPQRLLYLSQQAQYGAIWDLGLNCDMELTYRPRWLSL